MNALQFLETNAAMRCDVTLTPKVGANASKSENPMTGIRITPMNAISLRALANRDHTSQDGLSIEEGQRLEDLPRKIK